MKSRSEKLRQNVKFVFGTFEDQSGAALQK